MLRKRAKFTLETPPALLPPVIGERKTRVAVNKDKRQLMLVIGPQISRAAMMERQQAARETAAVQNLQQEHDDLIAHAEALEAEAKAIRDGAAASKQTIADDIGKLVGLLIAYTETYDFQCDKQTFAKLLKLNKEQMVERLLTASGDEDGLREINRGAWGDFNVGLEPPRTRPYLIRDLGKVDGESRSGWTSMGSPEWLAELFPDWDESP